MAKSIRRVKKSNKRNRKHRNGKNTQLNHRGGASPSCLQQYTGVGSISPSLCGGANIHNTNPQAMGDLDMNNKFSAYGGPVPLGSNLVGGSCGGGSCGDEGSYTGGRDGAGESKTFKQYLNNLSSSLNVDLKGGYMAKPQAIGNSKSHLEHSQHGAGYGVDPSQMVGGLAVNVGYDDCCPPALIGGQMVSGGPDQRVCGLGAVQAGGRSYRRKAKSNKHKSRGKKHRKSQRGGDFVGVTRSRPSSYDDAFTGPASYFDEGTDLSKRNFGAVQPNYDVMAI
jgi:hypothetical protein